MRKYIVILTSVSLLYLVSSSMNAVISGSYSFINPFETKFLRPSNFHMPVVFTRRSLNFAAMCLSSRVRNQADFVLVLFPYNQMTFLSLNFFTTKPHTTYTFYVQIMYHNGSKLIMKLHLHLKFLYCNNFTKYFISFSTNLSKRQNHIKNNSKIMPC